jgi:hypothetical protein
MAATTLPKPHHDHLSLVLRQPTTLEQHRRWKTPRRSPEPAESPAAAFTASHASIPPASFDDDEVERGGRGGGGG